MHVTEWWWIGISQVNFTHYLKSFFLSAIIPYLKLAHWLFLSVAIKWTHTYEKHRDQRTLSEWEKNLAIYLSFQGLFSQIEFTTETIAPLLIYALTEYKPNYIMLSVNKKKSVFWPEYIAVKWNCNIFSLSFYWISLQYKICDVILLSLVYC